MKITLHRSLTLGLILTSGLLLITPLPHIAQSQDPAPQRIESNDPRVAQSGDWSAQSTPHASGGSYLHNLPAPLGGDGTMLTFQFSGPAIEVIYIAGPSLGTLAINVDDTVLRTVITTADQTAYQQSARIDYLSNEPHTLKVYAQEGGIVAIDAFIIPTSPPDPLSASSEGETSGESRETYCAPSNQIHRVSLDSTGGEIDEMAETPSISADGRYVTFITRASLIPGDDNLSYHDAFLYDRKTCTLELISVSSEGVKGNVGATQAVISANGRYVAFASTSTNLVSGDTNGIGDIFVRDRQTQTTTRVSVATNGTQGTGFWTQSPAISADGRYVAFVSDATGLVPNDTNNVYDVFWHDRQTHTTTRVSIAPDGTEGNAQSVGPRLSADGRYVAFISQATNLVPNDTNLSFDAFVRDMQSGTTTRVSVASGNIQTGGGDGATICDISADGRYVSFASGAYGVVPNDTNMLSDIFVHDRTTSITKRVSESFAAGDAVGGHTYFNSISADGRYVAFASPATNLVYNDTNDQIDVFVRDLQTNNTTRVSVGAGNVQTILTGGSSYPDISADGKYIAFTSSAINLIEGDYNEVGDVFVTPRVQPTPDSLALFNPPFQFVARLNTLTDNPPASAYTAFSAYAPVNNGQWVMGDWNGDGLDTPGVYRNGVFYFTNKSGESLPADWGGFWIGITGPVVAGHFSGAALNDCIGGVDSGVSGGVTIFALYFTCDMSGTTLTPALSFQWLSAPLPDPTFSGTHQFMAGDFNGDGLDSIAVRRGEFIAFGNVNPPADPAVYNLAQYIGAPGTGDYGSFVIGDWDGNGADSFGLFYQNGELFYRNDLDFNSGVYFNQSIGTPFAGTVQVATWR